MKNQPNSSTHQTRLKAHFVWMSLSLIACVSFSQPSIPPRPALPRTPAGGGGFFVAAGPASPAQPGVPVIPAAPAPPSEPALAEIEYRAEQAADRAEKVA